METYEDVCGLTLSNWRFKPYKPGIEMARTYGGWAGRASYLGAPYDTAALANSVLPPDDDDWVNQVLQAATSANYIDD